MPKKSFTVGSTGDSDPVEFELVGTDSRGNPIQPISFLCKPKLQGVVITELYQGDEAGAGKAAIDIIAKAVLPEYQALYDQVIHSDEIIVDIATLANIAKYLIEVYANNPLNAPSGFTPGPQPTGPTSMADYLSAPEPTLQPSPPIVSSTPPIQ